MPQLTKIGANSTVSTILARCLTEPAFAVKVSEDPATTLRNYQMAPPLRLAFGQFEFSKLQLFGALITQTQHNFLWETFPYSRELLKYFGIELSSFKSYRERPEFEATVGLPRKAKIDAFTNYLRQSLTGANGQRYPGLLEVLTHERISWELNETSIDRHANDPATTRAFPRRAREIDRLIPRFPKTVRFAEHRYNPIKIINALKNHEFEPQRLRVRTVRLFYRIDLTVTQLSVFEANATVWQLFKRVNGERSLGSIVAAVAAKHPNHEMRRYFESAWEGGLIEFNQPL